jgi:hypothetical protein
MKKSKEYFGCSEQLNNILNRSNVYGYSFDSKDGYEKFSLVFFHHTTLNSQLKRMGKTTVCGVVNHKIFYREL